MRLFFYFILTFLFLLPVPLQAGTIDDQTLDGYYRSALSHSLKIKISSEEIDQARARYLQALGNITPVLTGTASYFFQDNANTTSGASSFFKTRQPAVGVNMSVPLFQGFKEMIALKMSRYDKILAGQKVMQAERALFMDVAATYFSIMRLDRTIQCINEMIAVHQKTTDEVYQRVAVGKSLPSELLAQESRMSLLVAEKQTYLAERAVQDEIMAYLTGRGLSLVPRGNDAAYKKQMTLPQLLSGVDSHPDIKAVEMEAHLARLNKKAISSELLPQVSLSANYYPHRSGFYESVKWDSKFTVELPLFDLNKIGQIREYSSLQRQAASTRADTIELLRSQIRQGYQYHQGLDKAVRSYSLAAQKARGHMGQVLTDYRSGLATPLEVLKAQGDYEEVSKKYQAISVDFLFDTVKLQFTAGVIP
ncbi:MAG: TolC family protein [Deltaproteobacteria bacterium]|nr:TolC family protein [Deltaproteobacteria bacterium]